MNGILGTDIEPIYRESVPATCTTRRRTSRRRSQLLGYRPRSISKPDSRRRWPGAAPKNLQDIREREVCRGGSKTRPLNAKPALHKRKRSGPLRDLTLNTVGRELSTCSRSAGRGFGDIQTCRTTMPVVARRIATVSANPWTSDIDDLRVRAVRAAIPLASVVHRDACGQILVRDLETAAVPRPADEVRVGWLRNGRTGRSSGPRVSM